MLLFGVAPDYDSNYRHLTHPGMRFIANLPKPEFSWPVVDTTPSDGSSEEPDISGWQDEHPLKSRFGYNVDARENLSPAQRRARLRTAIKPPPEGLGLRTVSYHIAAQISLSKNRNDRRKAIQKWKADLDWLYQSYYHDKSSDFGWPWP